MKFYFVTTPSIPAQAGVLGELGARYRLMSYVYLREARWSERDLHRYVRSGLHPTFATKRQQVEHVNRSLAQALADRATHLRKRRLARSDRR